MIRSLSQKSPTVTKEVWQFKEHANCWVASRNMSTIRGVNLRQFKEPAKEMWQFKEPAKEVRQFKKPATRRHIPRRHPSYFSTPPDT